MIIFLNYKEKRIKMINQTIIEGRLTRDPELKKTSSGKSVTQFTVAVERPFAKDRADFIPVVAWEKKAEFVCQYFHRGNGISVIGFNQTRSYKNKDMRDVFVMEVVANEVNFPVTSPKANSNSTDTPQNRTTSKPNPETKEKSSDKTQTSNDIKDPFETSGDAIDISNSDLPF